MNQRIKKLIEQSTNPDYDGDDGAANECNKEKFAKLLIEAVLDEVKERAYYTGDRDWSDDVDRQWIQLEFGYGKLYEQR